MKLPTRPSPWLLAAALPLLLAARCGREAPPKQPDTPPAPERELNPDRLPALYFRAWHRSKPGMILEEGVSGLRYLDAPGGKPVPFSEYEPEPLPLESDAQRSPSGRYEVSVNKINERIRSSGCCAIQEFDYEVVVTERGSPPRQTKLASGPDAGWEIRGWTPDSRYALFSGEEKIFLVDPATRETIPVAPGQGVMRTAFAAGGRSLFIIRSAEPASRLERFDLATRRLTTVLTPAGDEAEMLVSPDGATLALWFRNVTGETTLTAENRIVLFRAADGARIAAFDLPRGNVTLRAGWRADGGAIGFTVGGDNYTQDVYSLDTRTGKVTLWYPPAGRTTGLYRTK